MEVLQLQVIVSILKEGIAQQMGHPCGARSVDCDCISGRGPRMTPDGLAKRAADDARMASVGRAA